MCPSGQPTPRGAIWGLLFVSTSPAASLRSRPNTQIVCSDAVRFGLSTILYSSRAPTMPPNPLPSPPSTHTRQTACQGPRSCWARQCPWTTTPPNGLPGLLWNNELPTPTHPALAHRGRIYKSGQVPVALELPDPQDSRSVQSFSCTIWFTPISLIEISHSFQPHFQPTTTIFLQPPFLIPNRLQK
jgi:hypothetical protein